MSEYDYCSCILLQSVCSKHHAFAIVVLATEPGISEIAVYDT